MTSPTTTLAKTFRSLHIPGTPLLLTNIYDSASALAIAALPSTRALATASYAVASAHGLDDAELTLEQNLASARAIAPIAAAHNLPLTVDWQDGYGARLAEGIGALLGLGVVGVNLEDYDGAQGKMMAVGEAAGRVAEVVRVAAEGGVGDFVVNARVDVLLHGGAFAEVVERGRAYLEAGATTVFVLGGSVGGSLSDGEVRELVAAFGGRLNAPLRIAEGQRTVRQWAELGVARLSVGPQLQIFAMKKLAEEAERLERSR